MEWSQLLLRLQSVESDNSRSTLWPSRCVVCQGTWQRLRAQSHVRNDIATNQIAQTCQSHVQCLFNVSTTSNIPWLSFEQCLLDTVSCTKTTGLSRFLRLEHVSELNSRDRLKLFYLRSCIWYKIKSFPPPTRKMHTHQQAKKAPSSNAP